MGAYALDEKTFEAAALKLRGAVGLNGVVNETANIWHRALNGDTLCLAVWRDDPMQSGETALWADESLLMKDIVEIGQVEAMCDCPLELLPKYWSDERYILCPAEMKWLLGALKRAVTVKR